MPDAAPPRPDAELKTRLTEAASQLLDEAGPTKLSLREVARRAGVSHAAPYNHFANKEAMLATLAVAGWRELDQSMADAQEMADPDPLQQLVATGLGYLRYAFRRPAAYKLMMQRQFNAPEALSDSLSDCSRAAYDRLLDALRALRTDRGQATDDEAVEGDGLIMWALVHGMAGLSIDTGVEGLPSDDMRVYRHLLTRIDGMFRPPP